MYVLSLIEPAPRSALAVALLPPGTTESDLLARAPAWLAAESIPPALTHPQRRREWLAGRVLAAELLTTLDPDTAPDLRTATDEFGRPHLLTSAGARAGAVSLSHGGGHVAALVALGAGRRAGLDLEPERAKTLALAPRFLHPDELAIVGEDSSRAALTWSLKETLYKLYGRRQLDFRRHLYLELGEWPTPPTALPATGVVPGRISHPTAVPDRQWRHALHFRRAAPDCWLTYCVSGGADHPSPLLN